jgi:1,2-phenylacetyl-CoA epoxidase catalytic subunit
MKTTTKKTYDSVKEVRKERERIAGELKGKSSEEIISYFREKRRKSNILKGKLPES